MRSVELGQIFSASLQGRGQIFSHLSGVSFQDGQGNQILTLVYSVSKR